jgi:nucleoside-diphosphate-sugar epimerase
LQSDPGAAKDYIWIDDAVSAIEYIATAGRSATYNVARGVQTTNEQWVHAICNETGSSLSMSVATGVGGFPPISTALLRNEFTCNFVDPLNKIAEIVQ